MDMAIGVVLEHIVPHTESLLSVIMTSAFNDVFKLKFEFAAQVEGEGMNKRITVNLDRKIVPAECPSEVTIQKDVHKTVEMLKARLKQDKKGNVSVKRQHIFMDTFSPAEAADQVCGRFCTSRCDDVLAGAAGGGGQVPGAGLAGPPAVRQLRLQHQAARLLR